jgi:hypothetical protein
METKQVHKRVGQTFLQFIHLQKHLRSRGADIRLVKVGFCVRVCVCVCVCVFFSRLIIIFPLHLTHRRCSLFSGPLTVSVIALN